MDISITLNGTRLNARVAVLLMTRSGYVFEQDKSGYLCPVGGRIKLKEDSETAAKREVREELGIDLKQVKMISVIENFFNILDEPFHEFCFLYRADYEAAFALPPGFHIIPPDQLADHDIRPAVIREFANIKSNGIAHRLVREHKP